MRETREVTADGETEFESTTVDEKTDTATRASFTFYEDPDDGVYGVRVRVFVNAANMSHGVTGYIPLGLARVRALHKLLGETLRRATE